MASKTQIMDDKLILTDMLTHLKYLLTQYGTAFKESSCPKMRQLVTKLSGAMGEKQFEVFDYMYKSGMYPVENAEAKKVKEVLSMHKDAVCPC